MRQTNSAGIWPGDAEDSHVLERREFERIDCDIYAQIVVNRTKVCNCIIKNLSAGGARILVPPHCWVPSAFELVGLVDDFPVKVRRVWTDGEEMGISFLPAR